MALDLSRHPCFDPKARHEFGRVHLPVAPKCNIQCNYCDRQYDCCNESRPGVTSTVLSPKQALEYYRQVRQRVPDLAVVGIAGPGDPFANAPETMETLTLIRHEDSDVLLCVATNGLMVGPHLDGLAELEVEPRDRDDQRRRPVHRPAGLCLDARRHAGCPRPGSREAFAGPAARGRARPQGTGYHGQSQHGPDSRRQ